MLATPSSSVFSFGLGRDGELGSKAAEALDSDSAPAAIPLLLVNELSAGVSQIACGSRHTLFLCADGTVCSCGSNEYGQLGLGKRKQSSPTHTTPHLIRDLNKLQIVQIAAGDAHSLAVTGTGHLFSWGSNSCGQLGHSNFVKTGASVCNPMEVNLMEVVQVACGGNHSLALASDGSLYAWGDNQDGQLGLGHSNNENKPHIIRSLCGVPLHQIAADGRHSCALSVSGAVFTWGSNTYGQLGVGDSKDRFFPVQVKSLRYQRVEYLCCGDSHTAALTKDGRVFTFGADTYGQLGHGKRDNQTQPKQIFELMGSKVVRIACGRCHTLTIVGGRVCSFGLGSEGQLGNGKRVNVLIPASIECAEFPEAVFAGGDRSFVVSTASNVKKGHNCQEPGAPFTLGSVRRLTSDFLLQEVSRNTLSDSLNRLLESVFASSASLNCSFLLRNSAHFGASRNNSGVDLDAVMQTFQSISESKHVEQICRVVWALFCLLREQRNGSIHKLRKVKAFFLSLVIAEMRKSLEWSMLPDLPSSPPDIEALRLYLILPWCPVFNTPESYSSVHVPFAISLTNLDQIPSSVIEYWWQRFEIRHFSRILRVFKGVVTHILAQQYRSGAGSGDENTAKSRQSSFSACLKLLAKLSEVNKKTRKVPFSMFYVNELADQVDIRHEYVRYVLTQDKEASFTFCNYPFIFNAAVKTTLLQTDAQVQMQLLVDEMNRANIATMFFLNQLPQHSPFLFLHVGRTRIVEDTISQLLSCTTLDLKKPLKVQFHGEEADDAGGVKKEFFMLLFQELLHPKFGMFTVNQESQQLWFSTAVFEELKMYQLVGMLCGLAIYNGVLVNTTFPLALYKKLLKQVVILEDLKDLSPTEGKSLESVLDYEGDDFEETMGLNFDIVISNFGMTETHELKPGGSEISVTKENREEYVDLYVEYRLTKAVELQFDAFADGFHRVVTSRILFFFQPEELMEMVVGNETYDWGEFEKNTQYHGEYWRYHPTIILFWEIFHELPLEGKKKFLLFLTGSDRIPLLGMSQITMTIQPTQGGEDYYPVAHTCFNLLDLPRTDNKEKLRDRLLTAIEHNTGFSLV